MVSKSPQLLLFTLLSLTFALNTSRAFSAGGGGGGSNSVHKDLNPDNPEVVEIAKFAVRAYNEQSKAGLTYMKVIKAESETWTGILYRLTISTSTSAGPDGGDYDAGVFLKPWEPNSYELISFKKA